MVYQGSKARYRKFILPIIQKCIDDNHITRYIEPFVGGANMIDHIQCKERIGSDLDDDVITLLKYAQKDNDLSIAPELCSFEHFKDVRENWKNHTNKYTKEYCALIGYCASFSAKGFRGGV